MWLMFFQTIMIHITITEVVFIIQRVFNLDKTEVVYVVRVDGDDDFFPSKTFYEEELKHSISHIRNKKLEELGI